MCRALAFLNDQGVDIGTETIRCVAVSVEEPLIVYNSAFLNYKLHHDWDLDVHGVILPIWFSVNERRRLPNSLLLAEGGLTRKRRGLDGLMMNPENVHKVFRGKGAGERQSPSLTDLSSLMTT